MSEDNKRIQQLEERIAALEANSKQHKKQDDTVRTILYVVLGFFAVMFIIGIIQFISGGH
ncbi:hypothetical protein [Paenibacillus segetis]|uniref:Uncharacterized protein n=1 Tax=Paenibacillus segetis TaxID=1325360 RepID=A0ABQ1Y9L6_9BACL|nr:hypothetical protein [Paenibacillus segetis]GGH16597.1 hypothetical protein GCM10008013_11460 [Paenibacillus segetis]